MSSEIQEIFDRGRDEQWRVDLRKTLTPKQRTAIPRVRMPELSAEFRISNNREVGEGLSVEQAVLEATRCLDCANPGCVQGCPVHNDIPGFVKNLERRNFREAINVLHRTTVLPAVCGRVCPQEKQCEGNCTYLKMGKPAVSIGALERFTADINRTFDRFMPHADMVPGPSGKPTYPIKIAVVGSGPSGLAFAGDMARRGYKVTVFEALSQFGGVLKYGIPEFCLPNKIVDREIDKLMTAGVEFIKDCLIGSTLSFDDLRKLGYKGVYLATGAGKPRFMGIKGENIPGVMTANEYLMRLNLLGPVMYGKNSIGTEGKRVAVIGGGNTAIDAVRFAVRNGAEEAMIVYRRSMEEIPARLEEIRHAREEGVKFLTLHNPVEYVADENGRLRAMRLQRMELGEPDESGRRKPQPIPGDIIEVPVDIVVVSVGYLPNPPATIPGMIVKSSGQIEVDSETLKSSETAIYAGGDIVRGPATVILAMGDGRRAAASMSAAFEKAMESINL